MKVSYVEASHRMSCNIFTHMAWLITDDYPEVGDDGLSIPNNMNKLSTLPTMSAHRNCIALHIPKENRSQATVPLSVAYPELVSRGVSKSRKFKWLVKVGACKDVAV